MAEVNNCLLPDELKYHIEFNVWLRDNGDGSYDMGMTDIAQTMAGSVIHCRPKSVGKKVKKRKKCSYSGEREMGWSGKNPSHW
jgi:glycine cleavage system H protein